VATAPDQAVCVSLELDRLRSFDPALRSRVVRAAARSLGVRLSFDDTARLLAVAGFNPDSDLSPEAPPFAKARLAARLDLPDGLRAQRTARELQLSRETS